MRAWVSTFIRTRCKSLRWLSVPANQSPTISAHSQKVMRILRTTPCRRILIGPHQSSIKKSRIMVPNYSSTKRCQVLLINFATKTTSPTNHAQAISYSNPALTQPKVIDAHSQYLTTEQLTNCFKDSNTVDSSNLLPTALLPKGWSTNRQSLIQDFNNHFDHNAYGIPRPVPIAHERTNMEILMECACRCLLYNAITDTLFRIDHPTSLSEILKTMYMRDSGYQQKVLDRLPDEEDYQSTFGWSFDAETLGTLLQRVPAREYGLTHLTPVMAQEEKGLLLFRQDWVQRPWDEEWRYFIWDQKSIYRVDEPTKLDDTVDFLISKGFLNNENLRTTELEEA